MPGVPHHVTQRGNRRQQTFFETADYRAYLDLMAESCGRSGVAIWAYCLMPNHVHLVAVPEAADGVVVCLGDMPGVSAAVIDRLIAAFDPLEGRAICVPTWQGKRGNPVLLARRFFAEVQTISGDVGAKPLLGEYPELVAEVPMPDDAVLSDIDTPDALARLRSAG